MLESGTRLGVYEIIASLGAGGMGEVYRATDTKLGRAVAIKVLPDAFAADPERVPRFEREAKVLASLNHPHIAALYGMDQADGRHFLIMELVEGATLADRLRAGAVAVEEALRVAVQIADALDAAHEQGIVHRDLKPANVKVTPEGKVKVLDFGLAKAVESAPASNLTHSPTLSVMATQAGMIMGTAAYMSPEQAKGLPVDRRSDVFSFGVVLYELLTGRQPFHGETVAEVMASVMIREADLAALPPTIHPRLRDIITRCLHKQPRQRWQSMGDLRVELETLRTAPHATTTAGPPGAVVRAPLWRRVLPIAAAMLLTAVVTPLLVERVRPVPPPDVVRLSISAPDMRLTSNTLAIAPGGAAVAYGGMSDGVPQLMVRRTNEFEARPVDAVRGTLPASVTFSPDGQSVVLVVARQLRRVDLRGGPPMTICAMPGGGGQGVSWHGSSLLFASGTAIYRVADTGGTPQPIVQFESGQLPLRPQALDDAGTLLYGLASGSEQDGSMIARQVILQTPAGTRTVLADDAAEPFYVSPNRVVYVSDGTLMAIPVDLRTGQAAASPVAVMEGIARLLTTAPRFHVAISADGALAFVPGSTDGTERRRLAFVQLEGAVEPLPLPPTFYRHPRLSPDGRQLAVETDDGKEATVWVGPATGTTPLRRLTFEGRNLAPIWTWDGQSLTFQSDRDGDKGLYLQRADGSAPAVRLTKADPNTEHVAESWSPDDRLLTFRVTGDGRSQIWMVTRDGAPPKPLVHVPRGSAVASAFSPDGRWVAYGSSELEAGWSVFVQPFPPTGVRYQLTNRQSSTPVWAADGKQLYFAFTNRVFRADVEASSGMSLGAATEFETANSLPSVPATRHFDIAPDGKRLLVVLPEGAESAQRTSINVVLNWSEELKAKVP